MAPARHPVDDHCVLAFRLAEQRSQDNAFSFGLAEARLRAYGGSGPPVVASGVFGAGRRCGRAVGGGVSEYELWINRNVIPEQVTPTLSVWANIEEFATAGAAQRLIAGMLYAGSPHGYPYSYGIRLQGADSVTAEVTLGPNEEQVQATASGVSAGAHLFTLTWDLATLRLYIDGELAATAASGLAQTAILYGGPDIYQGGYFTIGNEANGFCGWQDDVALYNEVKSPAWIASVYDGTVAGWEGAVPSGAHLPLAGSVGRWLLEEELSTADAVDTSGNGYHLSPVEWWGDYSVPVASSVAGSRSRHCMGSYLQLNPPLNLITVSSLTLAAWVWPVTHPDYAYSRGIFRTGSYGYRMYGLASPNEHKYGMRLYMSTGGIGSQDFDVGFNAAVSPYTWHLFVGTFDSAAKLMRFYVDGELVDETSTAPYDTIYYGGTPPFWIGCDGDYSFLKGLLDEAAVYSTAKSAEWVASVYEAAPDSLFSLTGVSLEYAPVGIARKAVPMESGNTLPAADGAFGLSAVTLEYQPVGIVRKAIPMESGATLPAADGLFSLSGITLEYQPIGRLRSPGAARSGS